jgi:nucleotide-binding universal stress UspA family protein
MNPRSRDASPVKAPFAFGTIMCAVNRSRGADDAHHQAVQLVGPFDELTFVAVSGVPEAPEATCPALDAGYAEESVLSAHAAALDDGVDSATLVVYGRDVGTAIVRAAAGAGLLVLGAHGRSRPEGMVLGDVAARVIGDSRVPVLVARGQAAVSFPGMVLVGTEGSTDHHAVEVAATIASRHDGSVVLGHVGRTGIEVRSALADQAATVFDITGTEPVVVSVVGDPATRLLAMARSIGAALVVLGDRGKLGTASVSERIAHRAACSVLVLRSPRSLIDLNSQARVTA